MFMENPDLLYPDIHLKYFSVFLCVQQAEAQKALWSLSVGMNLVLWESQ